MKQNDGLFSLSQVKEKQISCVLKEAEPITLYTILDLWPRSTGNWELGYLQYKFRIDVSCILLG